MTDKTDNKKRLLIACMKAQRWQEAKTYGKEICQAEKGDPDAWHVLGVINVQLGLWNEALPCWRKVIALQPGNIEAQFNLGQALHGLEKYREAACQFQNTLQLKPDSAEAYHGLGCCQVQLSQFENSAESFRKAVSLSPEFAEAYLNLGITYRKQGKLESAISCYQKAMQIAPGNIEAHSNSLLAMHYLPKYDPSSLFQEHCLWAETHAGAVKPCSAHLNTRDPQRRLRIGYLSPDLRTHSVAFFFEPLLANHDGKDFEIVCYADAVKGDHVTSYFQSLAHQWRDIAGLSNDKVAGLIMQDGIDILVDLAGHTGRRRLLVFAAKSAPVQVTYLGYPDTTGLATIDYRLTDAWADPPGDADQRHTEELIRLPRGFLCYRSIEDSPAVNPLPALTHGQVTFGSFNNLSKLTADVISVWAKILRAVPGSRLLLKNKSFDDEATVERYKALFAQQEIAAEQLDLVGWVPVIGHHLESYGRIDIALDTFPYNGTTTTCEALWMGVPVITVAGNAHAGRVGMSLLNQIGFPEWIATNSDDYVARAVALAGDLEHLVRLRKEIRSRMQGSPLCDGQVFARDVEAVYREMWGRYCAGEACV